jgi:hypothetical protein
VKARQRSWLAGTNPTLWVRLSQPCSERASIESRSSSAEGDFRARRARWGTWRGSPGDQPAADLIADLDTHHGGPRGANGGVPRQREPQGSRTPPRGPVGKAGPDVETQSFVDTRFTTTIGSAWPSRTSRNRGRCGGAAGKLGPEGRMTLIMRPRNQTPERPRSTTTSTCTVRRPCGDRHLLGPALAGPVQE